MLIEKVETLQMSSDTDISCENDPNFAVICAFLEKFGPQCGLPNIDFLDLQEMLENSDEVHPLLLNLILKVLKKVKKSVNPDKWEKHLSMVCHRFSTKDAWEVERFGYKKSALITKVRVLKELLEMQFDYNIKFKNEINKMSAIDLRSEPLGRDKAGHNYWYQSDECYHVRVYKENVDDETWALIAKDRDSLVSLISQLSDGDYKISSDSTANEDSNSLSEKPSIDEVKHTEADKEDKQEQEKNRDIKDIQLEENKESNENPNKPLLRIKNVNDLIETGKKRSLEEEQVVEKGKMLKIEITKMDSKEIDSGSENKNSSANLDNKNEIKSYTTESSSDATKDK